MVKTILQIIAILVCTPILSMHICHCKMNINKDSTFTNNASSMYSQDSLVMQNKYTKNDTLIIKQDSVTLKKEPCKKDSIVNNIIDSLRYYNFLRFKDSLKDYRRQKYQNDAFKIPKYDPFREKMKDPWLGDILRNIFFR